MQQSAPNGDNAGWFINTVNAATKSVKCRQETTNTYTHLTDSVAGG